MNEMRLKNLEVQCAELGRHLADINGMGEKVLNAALAVLEEQGPYAMFLYVVARHNNVARQLETQALSFLKDVFGDRIEHNADIMSAVKALSEDLDDLLFARDLLRTALSYARYHVKAREGGRS